MVAGTAQVGPSDGQEISGQSFLSFWTVKTALDGLHGDSSSCLDSPVLDSLGEGQLICAMGRFIVTDSLSVWTVEDDLDDRLCIRRSNSFPLGATLALFVIRYERDSLCRCRDSSDGAIERSGVTCDRFVSTVDDALEGPPSILVWTSRNLSQQFKKEGPASIMQKKLMLGDRSD